VNTATAWYVDADGDGVLGPADECPTEAGPALTMGCPDRDQDGVADKADKAQAAATEFPVAAQRQTRTSFKECRNSRLIRRNRLARTASLKNSDRLPEP
jgi:hypothetical protein